MNASGKIFPAEVQDILWKKIREFAGFLKHADRDPEGSYDGPEEEANDWVLFLASLYYRADLGRPPTLEMSVLIAWLSALNPGAPESVLKGVNPAVVEAFPDSIRTLPRGKTACNWFRGVANGAQRGALNPASPP